MDLLVKYQKKERKYLPQNFKLTVWSKLKPYYTELESRTINSSEDLEKWILDWCELNDVVSEEFRWRYIRFSCENENEKIVAAYQYAVQELTPRMSPYSDALNRKLLDNPFLADLAPETYFIFIRSIKKSIDLYREENIELIAEIKVRAKEHGRIFAKMMVDVNGNEVTLQKARAIMETLERAERAVVYKKIGARLAEDAEELESIFDDLLQMRHQIALNTGFKNYRDYKFQSLGRFDYSVQDCLDFHDAIAKEFSPIISELDLIRKKEMGVDKLRPWDTVVDIRGGKPVRPFETIDELIQKSTETLEKVHPFFGEILNLMHEKKHLDLDSRKGKHPGGYNMPLPVSGIPFIFMNATNSLKDMRTMMHEMGHGVHSYLISKYSLNTSKNLPSEIAELAAMTMELLSMDYWDVFFENKEDLRRAKIDQLENVLKTLPWVATIDKFQHWLYTNHDHSSLARDKEWRKLFYEFNSKVVDWTDLDENIKNMWHRQLHIFEVPFYYIEYGMAQLGAIAIWRAYRENPKEALDKYIHGLSLGYTKSIPEIYEAAGIEFNFSREYVHELGEFVRAELHSLIFD